MKAIATLLLLSIGLCNAQSIISDLSIRWMGELQDIGATSQLTIDNLTTVYTTDGTNHQVTDQDGITFIWNRLHQQGNGQWQRELIDTAFQIQPSQHTDVLCYGIFMLECIAIDNITGRMWGCSGPCKVIYNIENQPQCPELITAVEDSYLSDSMWLQWSQKIMFASADLHVAGAHEIPGWTPGDLDTDGSVGVADLLLFTGSYGQQY